VEKDGIHDASGDSVVSLCFPTFANWGLEIFRPFPTNCGLVRLLTTVFRLLLSIVFQHDVSKDMPATIAIVGPPNQTIPADQQSTKLNLHIYHNILPSLIFTM
jgi:hypothetical protein